jgi:hypothetical protein
MCAEPGHYKPRRKPTWEVGPEPVAMVPVVQLFARDVPDLPFPEGCDLLQVVWCPLIHEGQGQWTVRPELRWRAAVEVAGGELLLEPPRPYEYDDEYVPRPCTVSPTRVVEYPGADLPDEVGERLGDLEERLDLPLYGSVTTWQSKVGGYPTWTQAPEWPDCDCGRRMEHLLSIAATEPCGGRWLPVDEYPPGNEEPVWHVVADPEVEESIGHDMCMGDLGGVYFFVCRSCPGMPFAYRYDCS